MPVAGPVGAASAAAALAVAVVSVGVSPPAPAEAPVWHVVVWSLAITVASIVLAGALYRRRAH